MSNIPGDPIIIRILGLDYNSAKCPFKQSHPLIKTYLCHFRNQQVIKNLRFVTGNLENTNALRCRQAWHFIFLLAYLRDEVKNDVKFEPLYSKLTLKSEVQYCVLWNPNWETSDLSLKYVLFYIFYTGNTSYTSWYKLIFQSFLHSLGSLKGGWT